MNSHLKLIETEFPDVIKRRMFQRDENAARALTLKGKEPTPPVWFDRYETWREYARLFPQEFRNIVRGFKDSPDFIDMKIDLKDGFGYKVSIMDLFAKRNFPALMDVITNENMTLLELINHLFNYNVCTWAAFFHVEHRDRQRFCDQAWETIQALTNDNYLLFRAAIITTQPAEVVLHYCPADTHHADIYEALRFCMAYPYSQTLNIALISRLLQSNHYDSITLLLDACDEGDLETARYLVENTREKDRLNTCVKETDEIDMTPLLAAIRGNSLNGTNIHLVQYLLDKGSDVVAECATKIDHDTVNDVITPINQAIYSGNRDLVMMLLVHYVREGRIHETLLHGYQILHVVCEGKSAESLQGNEWKDVHDPHNSMDEYIKYLLDNGARDQIHVKTQEDDFTPLHLAVTNHGVKSVKLLVEAGADVNARTSSRKTPLFKAYDAEVMAYLINQGADIFATDNKDRTALVRLCQYFYTLSADFGCISTLAQLSLTKMPLAMSEEEHEQWLDYWRKNAECYKKLAKLECSHDLQFLVAIATRQKLNEVKMLIKFGANIKTELAHPHTALSIAKQLGSDEVCAYLERKLIPKPAFTLFDNTENNGGEPETKKLKY